MPQDLAQDNDRDPEPSDIDWDIRDVVHVAPGEDIPLRSHTRVELQPGTHRLSNHHVNNDLEHYRLLGSGEDCIIKTDGNHRWVLKSYRCPGPIEVGNFVVDYWDDQNDSGGGVNLCVKGHLWAHDIRYDGWTPPEETGDHWKLNVRIKHPDGWGWVERIESLGSSHMGGHLDGKGMGIVDYNHEGTLVFRDNLIHSEPGDAPWYTQGHGINHFRDSRHVDNAMGNFRIGGRSTITNCVSVHDHDNLDYSGEFNAANDVLIATQINKNQTGAVVENCDFIKKSIHSNGNAVRHHLTSGDVTIKNTRIQHDDGAPFISRNADYGDHKYEWSDPSNVDWIDCDISGERAVDYVFDHDRRSDCKVHDCRIDIDHDQLCTGSGTSIQNLMRSDVTTPRDRDPRQATPFGETPDRSDGGEETTTPRQMRTIDIQGIGVSRKYRIGVSGTIEQNGQRGSVDPDNRIDNDGQGASGVVVSGTDAYDFEGKITEFTLDEGDADGSSVIVRVDGEEVSMSDLPEAELGEGDTSAPSPAWEVSVGGEAEGVAVDDQHVYVCDTTASVTAFDYAGSEQWTASPFSNKCEDAHRHPGGGCVVVSQDGTARSIQANGSVAWTTDPGLGKLSSVVVDANGVVYAGAASGDIACIAPDGSVEWTAGVHDGDVEGLAVHDGLLYTASDDNSAAAVGADGSVEWSLGFSAHQEDVAIDNVGKRYYASDDSAVRRFDPESAAGGYMRKLGSAVEALEAAPDGVVWGGDTTHVSQIAADSNIEWQYKTDSQVEDIAYCAAPAVVLGCADGSVRWLDVPEHGTPSLGTGPYVPEGAGDSGDDSGGSTGGDGGPVVDVYVPSGVAINVQEKSSE